VEKVKEILNDQDTTEEMSVSEWLRRLNQSQYAKNFSEKKVYFVTDLRHFNDERMFPETFKLKERGDINRLIQMIKGEKKTKEDFQLISKNKAR
jgi:hypothetical protein